MSRKPNTTCVICKKAVYRRPWEIEKYSNSYCSKECMFKDRALPEKQCEECNGLFQPKNKTQRFCSKSCVGKSTRNRLGTKNGSQSYKSNSEKRLDILVKEFNFTACMVKGCDYSITYDIHRFIHKTDGGKYEIGNMFAICPNHHAEHHRGFIELDKENAFTLTIKNNG